MNKRRLTRRQAWRVNKIQEERLRRAERKTAAVTDTDPADGPERFGRVMANYGALLEIEDETGAVHRCACRQNLGLPVVGDEVVWQAGREGLSVVTALRPRRSLLARPDASGEAKPLAANVDQILVVAAPLPRYDTELIDSYLIAAEALGIHPVIVLNKIDLLDADSRARLDADFEPYTALGYHLLRASTIERHGLDALAAELRGKTSVFVGQSGVGKSSLVNALLPTASVRVGELTEAAHGRHTTSAARLYQLDCGGALIDSPGVRAFRLWAMTREQLARGFPEFRPLLGQCRFRDCRHEAEPGCALRAAVADGKASAERLASYQHIALDIEERHRPDWG
ncbi:MAG: small ribosomal subunit biogenesis GTPase RsgA [Gammaproteobacteria bacterium]|nr:small ribosomal subunit biogenesis GTPase RsgA [Gammaproteobacteria bacterium]